MKVKQLIDLLKKEDENADVVLSNDCRDEEIEQSGADFGRFVTGVSSNKEENEVYIDFDYEMWY